MSEPVSHAFLRLTTEQDLWDLIALLKRGVRVCIEPVVGTLHGPMGPNRWATGPEKTARKVRTADLESFLREYLVYPTRTTAVYVEAEAHGAEIHEAWEILNYGADYPLRACGIAKLAQLLSRVYGGAVECQLPYGHPEWTEWVKAGLGHLTFHRAGPVQGRPAQGRGPADQDLLQAGRGRGVGLLHQGPHRDAAGRVGSADPVQR